MEKKMNTPLITFWDSLSQINIKRSMGRDKIYSVERIRLPKLFTDRICKITNFLVDMDSVNRDDIRITYLEDSEKKDVVGSEKVIRILSKKLPESFLLRIGSKKQSHYYIFRNKTKKLVKKSWENSQEEFSFEDS
jgi:hypothetical protein